MSASSLAAEPTYRSVPAWHTTLGPEVADVNRMAGFGPDPEQEFLLDVIFGRDRQGKSVAAEAGVVVARQNMKTGLFKQAAIGWMFVTDERMVIWSAHEFDTAQEAFRDLDELVTGSDMLRKRVKKIHRGNGDESIELVDDRRLKFKTRTKVGGRGLSGRKVILDEAFALQPMHMGALLPTMLAQPDPQVLYGSSGGLVDSVVLRDVRDRGRAGSDPRLAYVEYCAPAPSVACDDGDKCSHARDAVGCGCDKPEMLAMANPAMGRRITLQAIQDLRRSMPPEEFARECMTWWDDAGVGMAPIPAEKWRDSADAASKATDPVAFAVDVTPDRLVAAIGCAGRRGDGLTHGEVVEHGRGTGWVVPRLLELVERWQPCAVVIDPAGAAGAFIPELEEHGVRVKPDGSETRLELVTSREYAQACGALVDDVVNDRWRHLGQDDLGAAVAGAKTRPLGDAWAWTRKDTSVDISPLVAITLARHGFAVYGPTDSYDLLESIR